MLLAKRPLIPRIPPCPQIHFSHLLMPTKLLLLIALHLLELSFQFIRFGLPPFAQSFTAVAAAFRRQVQLGEAAGEVFAVLAGALAVHGEPEVGAEERELTEGDVLALLEDDGKDCAHVGGGAWVFLGA